MTRGKYNFQSVHYFPFTVIIRHKIHTPTFDFTLTTHHQKYHQFTITIIIYISQTPPCNSPSTPSPRSQKKKKKQKTRKTHLKNSKPQLPKLAKKKKQKNPETVELELERERTGSGNGGQIRYRSPSSAELFVEGQISTPLSTSISIGVLSDPLPDAHQPFDKMSKRKSYQQDSIFDKIHRYRGVILVITLPMLLISLILYMMPRPGDVTTDGLSDPVRLDGGGGGGGGGNRFAVIFDAGSSGSRVHVFCFDKNLDLVPIGNDLELFVQKKLGLSAYAADPQEAANSLVPLLEQAVNVVPKDLRGKTPVRVGATAGLRQLAGDTPDRILQAVKDLLKDRSDLKFESDWVTVLDGTQEGAFQWVTINYLLGNMGKKYSETVGVVDLGGGSVQMAYAISDSDASKAPKALEGEEAYVRDMYLKGRNYHLYVHSYLRFGLLAARAEILKTVGDSENPCVMGGYQGSYTYGGVKYDVSASPSGGDADACRDYTLKALRKNETCTHIQCTFGGVWSGGGGGGQKKLFVASFFFDRAAEAGFVDSTEPVATVHPSEFMEAAKKACGTKLEEAETKYPHVEEANLPYLCMDLVYQYTLLVDGFGLAPSQQLTLVKKVPYGNAFVEAAWPLGSAIDVMSSLA